MSKKYLYSFAGFTCAVTGPEGKLCPDNGDLAIFAAAEGEPDHTLEFQIVEELSAPEGESIFQEHNIRVYRTEDAQISYKGLCAGDLNTAHLRIFRQGDKSTVQVKADSIRDRILSKLVLNAMEAEHHIVRHQGVLLHASFICHDGKAILFTAPSGTGKSTQAELWCRLRGARQINGDRASITVRDDEVRAWGVPFCGSSGVCENVSAPVAAIVYLSQAPATTITRLRSVSAYARVWEGCCVNTWDRLDVERCSQTVLDLLEKVPVFHLACTPDETAVAALERAIAQMR